MKLHRKVAIVTGAAQGIGQAIAQRFHLEGATVYALDQVVGFTEASAKRDALTPLRQTVHCDVRDESMVNRIAQEIAAQEGAVHILVNNAGINPEPAALYDTKTTAWEAIMDTNLKGIFLVSRAITPFMRSGAVILNIASILGLRGVRDCSAYSASKGGVISLTRAMARDYAPDIRVNALSPGAVQTAMFNEYLARTPNPNEERQRIQAGIPMGRLGQPEDIAAAAVFLASDDAAWITGHNLVVDGGDSV